MAINLITHLQQVKDFIHLSRDIRGDNIYLCASFLVDLQADMENLLGSGHLLCHTNT